MDEFLVHLKELRVRAAAEGREVVVCGDWNIAHEKADLKNWRGNTKNSGFLPEERSGCPASSPRTTAGTSTSYGRCIRMWRGRTPGGPTGAGLRQRHRLADRPLRRDPGLAARAVKAYVERAATHAERWSDHAPVTVVFDR
ncbi:hypothetical protein SHKM778_86780 [Streptomyces sp. KM77-8]|uniref:Endonuclease/exonuclease/phosphatase domain-containing protein n=1 Tax=Streptomyces haneummycinicus TaxID=3074435 RepID=A0AAT9HY60_9ACTN